MLRPRASLPVLSLVLTAAGGLLVSCGGLVGVDRATPGDSGADTTPVEEGDVGTDSNEGDPDVAPPGDAIAIACAPGTPASPDAFVELDWQHVHPACGTSSACAVFVSLTKDCAIVAHSNGITEGSALSPEDCLVVKTWATSAHLFDALQSPNACTTDTTTVDSLAVQLTDRRAFAKYDATCKVDPFGAIRACMQAVLDVYAPGVEIAP